MKLKLISSVDGTEKRTMYSKSDSSIAMIGNDTDKIIERLRFLRIREGLEKI